MVAALIDSLANESKEKKKGGSACRCCLSLSAEAPPKNEQQQQLFDLYRSGFLYTKYCCCCCCCCCSNSSSQLLTSFTRFPTNTKPFSFSFFKRTDSPGKAGEFQVETMKHLKVWTDMRSLICKKGEKGEEKLSAGRLHITP